MRATVLIAALALGSTAAWAGVYKITGPDGRVIYSDRPAPGAEEVDVGTVQTYSAPDLPESSAREEPPPSTGFQGYEAFTITEPEDDQTLRDNAGTVTISMSLEPALRPNHTISLFMDGKSLGGEGRTTSAALSNVDRGTHTVHAVILDETGEEVTRTPSITFHLKRVSIN